MLRRALLLGLLGHTVVSAAADSLVFVSSRQLARESVGCSLAHLGGVESEKALYAQWALTGDDAWLVTGGDTFVDGRSVRAEAARELADGLASLRIHVVAPSAVDLALPADLLGDVMKRSGARWLATNVQSAKGPKLETAVVRDGKVAKLRLLSLVPCDKALAKAGWQCTPPEQALRTALREASGEFVSVVTTLRTAERDRLIRKYPAVNAWLDARPQESGAMEARSTSSIVVESPAFGQFAVRLQFDAPDGTKGAFVDANLLEGARRSPKSSQALRKAIEQLPWPTLRRLRTTIEPIRERS